MKKEIKKRLKQIPFVKKCVEYRNHKKQNRITQNDLATIDKETERNLRTLRKTQLNIVLQQNSERNHMRKMICEYIGRNGMNNLQEKFSQEVIDELYFEARPLVSIIILNRNGSDKLKDLMESFEKSDFYDNFEIILVDSASTDESVEYMEKWKNSYDIQIICNDENRSFSAANNQAARVANGDYLLFLNNDVAVTDGWLDELITCITKEECPGAVGARLIYTEVLENKEIEEKAYAIQHRGIAFKDTMRQKQYFIRPYNMNMGEMIDDTDLQICERVAVTAAALMVNRQAFETVDGFSEEYMYGFEDVDLCLKLYKEGYKNYYCPRCLIYHYESGKRDKSNTPEAKQRENHNFAVFQGKWQKYLAKEILLDKLKGHGLFTEQKLQIAIAYGKKEKEDSLLILERQFKEKGYEVVYLNFRNSKEYYKIAPSTDVLLVFDLEYSIAETYNKKNDLICIRVLPDVSEENNLHMKTNDDFQYTIPFYEFLQNNACLERIIEDFVFERIDDRGVDICACMPNNDTKKFWGDLHYAEAMKREFEKQGYHANVLTRDEWYCKSTSKYIIFLRGNREYYPTMENGKVSIMWNISHPDEVSLEEYNAFDYVFFASGKLHANLKDKIRCESGVLMQCTDEKLMHAKETKDKKYELLFVGNSRHIYRQILKDLLPTEFNLTVFGRHWEEFPVQKYVRDEYVANEEVGQVYQDAAILLNDHWEDMKEQGIISNRIFDALAAGAFVISDYLPEIDEVFHGKVIMYKDKEDLKYKIDYYMKHTDERKEIAKQGQEIVWKHHTFSDRVTRMITVMQKL